MRKFIPIASPIDDNTRLEMLRRWGYWVHTHLKGRIFSAEGVSYLVLQEESESTEWLRVKSLSRERTVRRMHADEIEKLLPQAGTAKA
jgi:hypothetical protein